MWMDIMMRIDSIYTVVMQKDVDYDDVCGED
jgi:hypothetical protein